MDHGGPNQEEPNKDLIERKWGKIEWKKDPGLWLKSSVNEQDRRFQNALNECRNTDQGISRGKKEKKKGERRTDRKHLTKLVLYPVLHHCLV